MTSPGLVACDRCGHLVAPRGDHYSVHFANLRDRAPCPRSYPPTPARALEPPKEKP